jgi:DNA-binding transcriptional LysR family regulator
LDFRIRQLQCFLTLSDLLHYGRTARALYMSQPTITFQIKSLEEAFGVKFFERDRQQVRLTEAGLAFRDYAQNIMDTLNAAQECLSSLNTRLRLRVSCGPVGQFILLPAVIRALTSAHPDFDLEVSELTTEQQMSRLSEGEVDALLMVGQLPVPGIVFDPICSEPLIAMVSRQSPLAQRRFISVEDLRNTSIIASRLKDCRYHQPYIRSLLAPYGITPKFLESPQSCSVQLAYAASGEGVAIVSDSMGTCEFPHLVALPFSESLPEVELGLAALGSNETHSLNLFREIVLKCAAATLDRRSLSAPLAPPTRQPITVMSRREAS